MEGQAPFVAYVTIDTDRLYPLIVVFQRPAEESQRELALPQLCALAQTWLDAHYPQLRRLHGLTILRPQRVPTGLFVTWETEAGVPSSGVRAGVLLSLFSGVVQSCGVYVPPVNCIRATLEQSQAERIVLDALGNEGTDLLALESRLLGAHPAAPNEGPVWLVTVRITDAVNAARERRDTVIVDAVTGLVLRPTRDYREAPDE